MKSIGILFSLLLLTSMLGMAQPPTIIPKPGRSVIAVTPSVSKYFGKRTLPCIDRIPAYNRIILYSWQQNSNERWNNYCRPDVIALYHYECKGIKLLDIVTNINWTDIFKTDDSICPNHIVHSLPKPISPNGVSIEHLRTISPNLKTCDSLVFDKKLYRPKEINSRRIHKPQNYKLYENQ